MRFVYPRSGEAVLVDEKTIRCPGCSAVVELPEAKERSEQDAHAPLTCPTCGAGFDREGNLVHEPAIGP
jgi:uncharacterized C2H2 Zn-finger protein